MEIKKLEDVVTWFDDWIEETKLDLTEEDMEDDTTIKEFETIKKVILESIERHNVYTSALNNDIAEKAAKIEKLEKEIEGRKEGYTALKELMDTKYISIDEHNDVCKAYAKKVVELKKESEKWQDLAKMNRDTICNQYDVCENFKKKISELEEKVRHQRENLNAINKTLETRTKEKESLIAVRNNQDREIEVHESENARLTEKIMELKKEVEKLKVDLDFEREKYKKLAKATAENESIFRKRMVNLRKEISAHEDENKKLEGRIKELKKEKKEGDDYVREGFKLYVKNTLAEAEGNKNEANEVITETVRSAYAEWGKTQKEKEEKTEVKGVGRTSSGRYPWGAKVNDIPCGDDSIE